MLLSKFKNAHVGKIADPLQLRSLSGALLVDKSVRNKISWKGPNEYNQRWQFKFKHAYYSYPRDGHEHTRVMRPEETRSVAPLFGAWIQDAISRVAPGLQCWWDRRHRMFDPFSVYFLPGTSLFFYQFFDITLGFKILTMLPWFLLYTRIRDKTLDPDFKETYIHKSLSSFITPFA